MRTPVGPGTATNQRKAAWSKREANSTRRILIRATAASSKRTPIDVAMLLTAARRVYVESMVAIPRSATNSVALWPISNSGDESHLHKVLPRSFSVVTASFQGYEKSSIQFGGWGISMKRHLGWGVAVAVSIGSFASAMAADMPVKAVKAPPAPPCVWCGWYVGANGGWAWNDSTGGLTAFSTTGGNDFTPVVAAGGTPSFLGAKHEGGFGGGQFGYNWQVTNWLFGFEADIQGADIGKTSTVVFPGGGGFSPSVSTGRDHIDWFGTVRGRVGVTLNNVLLYGTGGLAYGGVNSTATNVFTPATSGTFSGSSGDTRFGWAAGAGVEWLFAPNWSVKGEYLHVDLGSSNTTVLDPVNFPGAFATYHFHHEFESARVGVNYHFGGPVVAKY